MRIASVSEIKTGHDRARGDLPGEGTLSRAIYDTLKANYGRAIFLGDFYRGSKGSCRFCHALEYLTDMYGCDIRRVGSFQDVHPRRRMDWLPLHRLRQHGD